MEGWFEVCCTGREGRGGRSRTAGGRAQEADENGRRESAQGLSAGGGPNEEGARGRGRERDRVGHLFPTLLASWRARPA